MIMPFHFYHAVLVCFCAGMRGNVEDMVCRLADADFRVSMGPDVVVLGTGLHGAVVRAPLPDFGVAAIKFVKTEKSFVREATFLGSVGDAASEANIVRCVGTISSVRAVVMECCEGDLRVWIKKTHERAGDLDADLDLDPDAGLRLVLLQKALEVTQGLVTIHDAGFVHMDLKPANVLLTCDHHAVVADFGSCQRVGTQCVCGCAVTPGFCSPQQVLGTSEDDDSGVRRYSAQTSDDVWALGVLLMQLFSGDLSLTGEKNIMNACWTRIRNEQTAPAVFDLSRALLAPLLTYHYVGRVPSFPEQVLLMRCLHPDPGSRLTSREVHAALRSLVEEGCLPVDVHPMSSPCVDHEARCVGLGKLVVRCTHFRDSASPSPSSFAAEACQITTAAQKLDVFSVAALPWVLMVAPRALDLIEFLHFCMPSDIWGLRFAWTLYLACLAWPVAAACVNAVGPVSGLLGVSGQCAWTSRRGGSGGGGGVK